MTRRPGLKRGGYFPLHIIKRREAFHHHRHLQPPLRDGRELRHEPVAPPRRHQGTGTVRKEHEGVPEHGRSRSRQALQPDQESGCSCD